MMKSMMAAVAAVVFATPVMAQTVSGTTTAAFVNPVPSTATTTGTGTAVFTYGQGDTPNSLTFVGTPFASMLETPFTVGRLSYYNGTTTGGTSPTSVSLAFTLSFIQPSIPNVTSTFPLSLVVTPNTGDADANADYVYFPSSYSTTTFVIGGTTYNVALKGFTNVVGDGFLASSSSEFHVREGGTASADLMAEVTTNTGVPEPATWGMMIAGFGIAGAAMRRTRRSTAIRFETGAIGG